MWTLILSLVLQQQAVGTPILVETREVAGITSEELCRTGVRSWLADYKYAALEPTDDWEAPDDKPTLKQPREDRFPLVVPIATCIQTR